MIKIIKTNSGKAMMIIIIVLLSSIISIGLMNPSQVNAHNKLAQPIELFSLWNDTSPTFDGLITFNSSSKTTEWSSGAVYNLYEFSGNFNSKLFLKNDNTNLYIGFDLTSFQIENPVGIWGSAIYLDLNHNGLLDIYDIAVRYINDGTDHVYYYQFSEINDQWEIIDSSTPGISLSNNILVNSDFGSSFFETINHRQFEIRVPLNVMDKIPGEIVGVGFEAFENFDFLDDELIWPYIDNSPSEIRITPAFWGDLYLGKENGYSDYSIELNFNIKDTAIGPNNGAIIRTGDIDGDSDDELLVASNRSVTGDSYLSAIYDYIDNELVQIWTSWTSSIDTELFLIKGLVTHDFTGDGKDEIYVVGEDSRIGRISDWNPSKNDFDSADLIFTHNQALKGYIVLGDADGSGDMNLVVGDQSNHIIVLEYDDIEDAFTHANGSPFGTYTSRYWFFFWFYVEANGIHALDIDDIDADGIPEVLAFLQISDDNTISNTELNIYQFDGSNYRTNGQDDLGTYSNPITEDNFGHTILTDDVDNDLDKEIILLGKNYLKIFGNYDFEDSVPPLEIVTNDGSHPQMGGGALVADVDDDSYNELVFSFNNGTLVIMNITDTGGNNFVTNIEWKNDFGSSIGTRNSIIAYDIDEDSETEIIFSDNFGQIFIIGKSGDPEVDIISPISGSTTNQPSVEVFWEGIDDHGIHHYDLYVEGIFISRLSGSQSSTVLPLFNETNLIELIAVDVNGKIASTSISIGYTIFAPEIYITSPENNFYTKDNSILLEYYNFDPNFNFDFYEIYRNGQEIVTSYTLDSFLLNLPDQGLYNITILGIDTLGYIGKSSIFVTKDTTPPFIEITNPIFGSYVSSNEIDLRWSTSDLYSEVSYFDIYKNGQFLSSTSDHHQTISLDIDRYYLFEVYAFDILGNNKSDTVSITKDTVAPTVNILSHTTGSIIQSSSINLVWSVSDNFQGSGIQYSEVIVNQESEYFGNDESAIINLGNDGLKDIQVISTDKAGNSKADVIFLTVDSKGPFIEITSPINNYNTSLGTIPLSWNAQDNGIGIIEYQISIDGVNQYNITDTSITNTLLPIPLDKSSVITIKAIDGLNQFTEDSIVINHNSSFSSLILTNPLDNLTYIAESELEVSWIYQNIPDITLIELYVNGSVEFTTTNISVDSYIVNLSLVPISIYPEINITIAYHTISDLYTDTKWVIVDKVNPYISIITPSNNSIIYQNNQYIQWSGYDLGVGLEKYELYANSSLVFVCSSLRNYYYLYFESGDGIYEITIIASDKVGNTETITYYYEVHIQSPIISTNLTSIYYTPTGDFQFYLNIIDPQDGIQKYQILLDDNILFTTIAYPVLITNATSFLINITSSDYSTLEGSHDLEIIIVDAYNRESRTQYTIIVDNQPPEILPDIYFDDRIISDEILSIELKQDTSLNNHSISITVNDNELISHVILRIIGTSISKIYEMIRVPASRAEAASFELTINLTSLNKGNYQILIQAFDFAGNIDEVIIEVDVTNEFVLPWYLEGLNIFYFVAAILFVIILISIISVSARRVRQNRNWMDEIVSILYIKSTGLTCVSANYIPEIIQDEQLIGGAMVAIQSILNEYSDKNEFSSKRKSKIRIIELGLQNMLIVQSNYGICALIVKELKPIHKSKLSKFTSEFETKYQDALKTLFFVDSTSFEGSMNVVEKYFGKLYRGLSGIIQNGITKRLEEYRETLDPGEIENEKDRVKLDLLEEKTPIDELLEKISREAKNQLIKIIERAPKIIILIIEGKIDDADHLSQEIHKGLNFLLRIERSNLELQLFIQNMNNMMREIDNSIFSFKNDDKRVMQLAIEKASQIWFEEIAEKWSDIA